MVEWIPYPLEYNHGVVFFNMSFWVRFNSKNPSKRGLFDQKMGFYSRKSPKTGLLKRGEVIFKSGAVLERIRYLYSYTTINFHRKSGYDRSIFWNFTYKKSEILKNLKNAQIRPKMGPNGTLYLN